MAAVRDRFRLTFPFQACIMRARSARCAVYRALPYGTTKKNRDGHVSQEWQTLAQYIDFGESIHEDVQC